MSETTPESHQPDDCSLRCIAEKLQRHSEELRALAEELKAKEETLSEVLMNYPHFKQFVYDKVGEHFEQTLEPLPDGVDLEAWAQERDGQPLAAFIHELEEIQ